MDSLCWTWSKFTLEWLYPPLDSHEQSLVYISLCPTYIHCIFLRCVYPKKYTIWLSLRVLRTQYVYLRSIMQDVHPKEYHNVYPEEYYTIYPSWGVLRTQYVHPKEYHNVYPEEYCTICLSWGVLYNISILRSIMQYVYPEEYYTICLSWGVLCNMCIMWSIAMSILRSITMSILRSIAMSILRSIIQYVYSLSLLILTNIDWDRHILVSSYFILHKVCV